MSEFEWIDRYLKPLVRSDGAQGLNNDVAELAKGTSGPLIVTLDTLIEGVHFLKTDPVDTVARKLVRVNVSDILCKGALPSEALLSVALPDDFSEGEFASFCEGLGEDLEAWGCVLLGGDTVSTPGPLTLSLTLTGVCHKSGPVLRSGALYGDVLAVAGSIGHGILGLNDAKAGRTSRHADHYRVPQLAPLDFAALVARYATASIDVSDGLISDAGHLARQSRHQIQLALNEVPFAVEAGDVNEALRLATGGDDYQILMTLRQSDIEACLAEAKALGQPLSIIGAVTEGEGGVKLTWHDTPVRLPDRPGYRHGNPRQTS